MAIKATAFPRRAVLESHFTPWGYNSYRVKLSCGHWLDGDRKMGKAKTVSCYRCPQKANELRRNVQASEE